MAPRGLQRPQGHGGAWLSAPGSRATCRTGPWVPRVAAGRGSQCGVSWDTMGSSYLRRGAGHSVAVLPVWRGERCHPSRHWCSRRSAWLDVPPAADAFGVSCSWCGSASVLVVVGWTPRCCLRRCSQPPASKVAAAPGACGSGLDAAPCARSQQDWFPQAPQSARCRVRR